MAQDHKIDAGSIDKGTMAIIELTAKRVVAEAVVEMEKKIESAVTLHSYKCEARKLGAFKASVVGAITAFFILVAQWLKDTIKL